MTGFFVKITQVNFMAAKYKNNNIRYEQTNRIIEKFLYDLKFQKNINFYLETCNVNAVCAAIEAVNNNFYVNIPKLENKPIMSQADLMFCYIYQNEDEMPVHDKGLCENEVIENLAYAAEKLAHVNADVVYTNTKEELSLEAKKILETKNAAIVLSYQDEKTPGHYITIVDVNKEGFIYFDPWGKNSRNKNGGNFEVFKFDDFKKCNKMRMIVITDKS